MTMNNVGHMNAGDSESSYAKNSGLQKAVISETMAVLDETLKEMFASSSADDIHGFHTNIKSLKMVDLGCSSGPNTLFIISHIINRFKKLYQNKNTISSANDYLPQIEVYLNDLPANDFNNLFKLLQTDWSRNEEKKKQCFYYGLPGSFYDSLFPEESLHFAYSSYSLHWLSQIPEGLGTSNKENIYMARTSPPKVFEAYSKQYQRDFSTFLRLRAEEMVTGGRMVLIFIGRSVEDPSSQDDCAYLTLLATTLLEMVVEGLVKMDDLYSFNVPIYTPCMPEVEAIMQADGSFNLDKAPVSWVRWDAHDDNINDDDQDEDVLLFQRRRGKLVADCVRAFMEPMLAAHFGSSIIDELFGRYAEKVADHLSVEKSSYFNIAISLSRK